MMILIFVKNALRGRMNNNNLFKLIEKFAALSDEQYKDTLRNPHVMQKLDEEGLLDKFYSSMPEVPKQEILERMEEFGGKKKETKVPKVFDEILEEDGDKKLPTKLTGQVKNIFSYKDETYTDEEVDMYSSYVDDVSLNELMSDYSNSHYYSESKLKEFFFYYEKCISHYNREGSSVYYPESEEHIKNIFDILNKKLVDNLITILKSIFASDIFEENISSKLTEALNLRESDYFDSIVDEFTKSNVFPVNYLALKDEASETTN